MLVTRTRANRPWISRAGKKLALGEAESQAPLCGCRSSFFVAVAMRCKRRYKAPRRTTCKFPFDTASIFNSNFTSRGLARVSRLAVSFGARRDGRERERSTRLILSETRSSGKGPTRSRRTVNYFRVTGIFHLLSFRRCNLEKLSHPNCREISTRSTFRRAARERNGAKARVFRTGAPRLSRDGAAVTDERKDACETYPWLRHERPGRAGELCVLSHRSGCIFPQCKQASLDTSLHFLDTVMAR